jgi:hypothetical protein
MNPYELRQIKPFFNQLNLQNKSFEHHRTNLIHIMNLLNTTGQIKSKKQIFWTLQGFDNPNVRICKSLTCTIVLKICEDSFGFIWICGTRENSLNFLKSVSWIESTKQIFENTVGICIANPDLWPPKSGFALHESKINCLQNWICQTNPYFYKSCNLNQKYIIYGFLQLFWYSCLG